MSFPNNYESNPYIHAAGLDNTDKWPELNAPSSPVPTPLEELPQLNRGGVAGGSLPQGINDEQGKWPGATGLKYTQTIMGNRSGVAGMRVNGRRTSKMGSPYVSGTLKNTAALDSKDSQNDISTSAAGAPPNDAVPDSFAPPVDHTQTTATESGPDAGGIANHVFLTEATPSPATPTTSANEPVPGLPDLPPLPPGFRPPKFARGAEMEARRRKRIQMRMPQRVVSIAEDKPPPPQAARPALHFDDTSSEEESDEQEEDTVEGSASDSEGSDAGEMPSDFEDVSFLRP